MALKTGVDLLEIHRLRTAVARHGEHFLSRVYTPAELELCAGDLPSLAARFAAKEAVAKALGTGLGDVAWTEIEVLKMASGAPDLHLHGKARALADELGLAEWSLSLSHSRDLAIALAVASG